MMLNFAGLPYIKWNSNLFTGIDSNLYLAKQSDSLTKPAYPLELHLAISELWFLICNYEYQIA